MGNEQVKVNLGSLDQMIAELASFDTEIEQQIAALESRVASLHTRWEGDGATKHAQAQAEWAKGAQLLSDGIKGLHHASAAAHRNFQETVAANKARFS